MDIEERIKLGKKKRKKTFWNGFFSFAAFMICGTALFEPDLYTTNFNLSSGAIRIIGVLFFVIGTGLFFNLYLNIRPYHYGVHREEDEELNSIFNYHLKRNLTDKYGYSYGDKKDEKPKLFNTELESFKNKYVEQTTHELEYAHLFEELYRLETKFKTQIDRLIENSNLNLIIGASTTSVAILILAISIFQDHNFTDYLDLASFFIPRISTVILVEVFSFFFLKLYKNNLEEIKYFQNEITNLNFKIASLKTAIKMKDTETISKVVVDFSMTERNKLSNTKDPKNEKKISGVLKDMTKFAKVINQN